MGPFDNFLLGEVAQGRGSKSIPITHNGLPPSFLFPDPMEVVFEPTPFGGAPADASRVNLILRASRSVATIIESLEQWAVEACAKDSERIFSQKLTEEQVRERFKSNLKPNDRYGPSLKIKLQLAGASPTKLWSEDRRRCEPPIRWKDVTVSPYLVARNMWMMASGRELGITLELTNAMIVEPPPQACPF